MPKKVTIRQTEYGPKEVWDGTSSYKVMLFAVEVGETVYPGTHLVFDRLKYAVDGNDIIGAYMSLLETEDCAPDDPDKFEFIDKKPKKDPETGEKIKKQSTLQWAEPVECTNGAYLIVVNAGGATGQIPDECIQQLFDTVIDFIVMPEHQGQFVPITE